MSDWALFFNLLVLLPLACYGWWCFWRDYIEQPFQRWLTRVLCRILGVKGE